MVPLLLYAKTQYELTMGLNFWGRGYPAHKHMVGFASIRLPRSRWNVDGQVCLMKNDKSH